jgi:hypothetical protein
MRMVGLKEERSSSIGKTKSVSGTVTELFIGSRSWKFDSQGGIMGGVLTVVSKWAISIRKRINPVW